MPSKAIEGTRQSKFQGDVQQSKRNWAMTLIYVVLILFGIDVTAESIHDLVFQESLSDK